MDVHDNARTTRHSRLLMVHRVLREGRVVTAVAAELGVDRSTVGKWVARYRREGEAGLRDRSSRPHRSPTRLSGEREAEIEALRRSRMTGPAIARRLGCPVSTIGVVLRRRGLGRLSALDPKPEIVRYERERPGELVHMDIKKLGRIVTVGHRITGDRRGQSNRRGTGWEHLHVCVDDRSRPPVAPPPAPSETGRQEAIAYTELLPDERKQSAVAFTRRAVAWFAQHGVAIERVMTDNGSAYKSHAFRDLLAEQAIQHKRTRPYTPRTNGKAERFIQTSLREWAYAEPFQTSAERKAAMHPWLHGYNTARPHAALQGKPPISRLAGDNVLGNDS